MRLVCHSASTFLIFLLGNLLLVQVLASAQPNPQAASVRSQDKIDSRGAIDWLEFRAAPGAVDDDLALASRGCDEQTAQADAAEALDERPQPEFTGVGGKAKLEWTLQQRKLAVADMHERSSSSPAVTSAAPTVFGVSIYLIVAWLALLYLMFRTGSISSTSDARNYADEIRG